MARLKHVTEVYVLSSDTYGSVQSECGALDIRVQVLHSINGGEEKRKFVRELGRRVRYAWGTA
jgi:soluble P-type ATPase